MMSTNLLKEETHEEKEVVSEEKEKKFRSKGIEKVRVRKFPIWLRLIVIFVLSIISLVLGLMVGYGVLGDGNPIDALKIDTWQHIIDIVEKEK